MKQPPACPHCGSTDAAEIVYGLPYDPSVFEQERRGEIVLAGCVVTSEAPLWECRRCKTQFGKRGARASAQPYLIPNADSLPTQNDFPDDEENDE